MILTFAKLQEITGPITPSSKQESNAVSAVSGLNTAGRGAGLHMPHRLAFYLGQILHESAVFRYDRELWGPTPAQERYDTRTDLGNTPERDGDGFKYRGRGPIQITGKSNYEQFTAWARKIDHTAPDFVKDPDAVNVDPWEGMVAIWYWSTRGLNQLADAGDFRGVTKRINGGYNGLDDRQRWTDRTSLVLLGFGRNDVKGFQTAAGLTADGVMGPKTRAELHEHLFASEPLGTSNQPAKRGGKGVTAGAAVVAGATVTFWDKITEWACSMQLFAWLFSSCGG